MSFHTGLVKNAMDEIRNALDLKQLSYFLLNLEKVWILVIIWTIFLKSREHFTHSPILWGWESSKVKKN